MSDGMSEGYRDAQEQKAKELLSCESARSAEEGEVMLMNVKEKIAGLRASIRLHRDQKGDDRCWLDDAFVRAAAEERLPQRVPLPTHSARMRRCREFFFRRNAATADPMPPDAILDPALWDADLGLMDVAALEGELDRLRAAVLVHAAADERVKTSDDDRLLYAVLPEKIPADFRLPPEAEFLGRAKSCVGCPSFWQSHESCDMDLHDLGRWGPCGAKQR